MVTDEIESGEQEVISSGKKYTPPPITVINKQLLHSGEGIKELTDQAASTEAKIRFDRTADRAYLKAGNIEKHKKVINVLNNSKVEYFTYGIKG